MPPRRAIAHGRPKNSCGPHAVPLLALAGPCWRASPTRCRLASRLRRGRQGQCANRKRKPFKPRVGDAKPAGSASETRASRAPTVPSGAGNAARSPVPTGRHPNGVGMPPDPFECPSDGAAGAWSNGRVPIQRGVGCLVERTSAYPAPLRVPPRPFECLSGSGWPRGACQNRRIGAAARFLPLPPAPLRGPRASPTPVGCANNHAGQSAGHLPDRLHPIHLYFIWSSSTIHFTPPNPS